WETLEANGEHEKGLSYAKFFAMGALAALRGPIGQDSKTPGRRLPWRSRRWCWRSLRAPATARLQLTRLSHTWGSARASPHGQPHATSQQPSRHKVVGP